MSFNPQFVHCSVMFEPILNEIPKPAVVLQITEDNKLSVRYRNKAFEQDPLLASLFENNPALTDYCQKLLAAREQVSPDNPIKGTQTLILTTGNEGQEIFIEFSVLKGLQDKTILAVLQLSKLSALPISNNSLLDDAADICVILDRQGRYLSVSTQFTEIMGYEASDIIGTNVFELVYPEDRSAVRENYLRLQNELSVFAPPFRFLKKDKSWCWLQSVGTNLIEASPGEAIIVNSRDITGLVQAQQDLELSNERYQLISNASKDALYDWDIQQDIFYWGEGYYRLFGYAVTDEPYRLSRWISMTHHQDAANHEQRWNSFLKDPQQNSWTNEFRFRKSDGTFTYVEEIAYLVRDRDGLPVRMIGSVRDISESKLSRNRKQLEQTITELFRSAKPLKEILQEVVDFLAQMGAYELSEIWLCSSRKDKMRLIAYHEEAKTALHFYSTPNMTTEISVGKGFTGKIWQTRKAQHWGAEQIKREYFRAEAAINAGIQSVSGIPLTDNNQLVGAVLFGRTWNTEEEAFTVSIFESIQHTLGAEIKRKQQEEEMRLMFESSPDILTIISAEGYFSRVNPAFCQLMGYSAQELTNRPFHYFVHPDDLEFSLRTFSETLIVEKKAKNFVNRYITKTGEHRWISWSSSESFGEEHQAFAYGKDITEMKQLEELIDNTSKLARVGSWEINMADKKIFCSKITEDILELKPGQQLQLNNRLEYIGETSKETIRKLLQAAIFDQEPWDIEIEILTRKGIGRWVRLIGQASFKNGRCDRIYGSIQDIHKEKLIQLQLEEANDRYERVSSATNDAIWDWDILNNRIIWSDRFEKIFGYPVQEKGTDSSVWIAMIHPEDFPELALKMKDAIEHSESHYFEKEFRFLKSDGNYAYVSSKSTFIRTKEGRAIRMVGALSDISVRKNYEASLENLNLALKRINQELKSSNAELEQFAFVASHDLQEPLRMITGFLTMLEKKYGPQLDSKANQYIYYAVDGAKRMRGIILDLLEYSRVGRMNTTVELVNPESLVKEVSQLLQNQIEEKAASISTGFLPGILTYKVPLQQILQNLVSNALKYGHPDRKPEIRIELSEKETAWEFSVKDNGIGIEPDAYDKIFVIFQRLNYTPDIPGSGMGLAIAKKIVEWQGGKIWVESEPGAGSTFYFTLPKTGTDANN